MGCAIIRHTPKTPLKKEILKALSGKKYIKKENFRVKYRISRKGILLSGKAYVKIKDTLIQIKTNNLFTGRKNIKVNIKNTGYPLLDFLGLYLSGKSVLSEFKVVKTDDGNAVVVGKSDTLSVGIKSQKVVFLKDRNNNVSLFYNKKDCLQILKGTFEGFDFETYIEK